MRRIPGYLAVLFAFGIVFSPLIGAFLKTGVHFQNIHDALCDIFAPLRGSILIALTGALAAMILGSVFAILAESLRSTFKTALWFLALLPLIIPPYLAAEACVVLFGPAGKISRPLALCFGLGPHASDPTELARYTVPSFVYSWQACGAVMGGWLFPIVALAVASAMRRTDHRIFESARLSRGTLGVVEIASRVLVPPALGAAMLVFAVTLTEFAAPQLLRVRTLGETIYERIQEGDLASASAIGMLLSPLIAIAGGLGAWILVRSRAASLAGLEGDVPRYSGKPAGRLFKLAALLATLIAIIPGLILPAISLVWLTLTAKIMPSSAASGHKVVRASGFFESLKGAWDLAQNDAIRTVLLAGVCATLATLFALVLVRLASRAKLGWTLGILGAGLAIPAPIVGLGLISLWNHAVFNDLYQSPFIVMLAWLARFFPIVVFLTRGALSRVPRELEEAASLMGHGAFTRWTHVILPGAAPGIFAAWLAFYVLSSTEFCATLLIDPAGSPLLAPSVVNLMRRGQDPEIAACQFLLLAVVLFPPLLISLGALIWRRFPYADKESR